MGIRFCCPNGHKLNVKAELAGKIGVCPKCRARTTIPKESVFDSDEFRRLQEPETTGRPSSNGNGSNDAVEPNGNVAAPPNGSETASNASSNASSSDALNDELRRLMRDAVGDVPRNSRKKSESDEPLDNPENWLKDANVDWFVQTPDNRSYGPAPSSVLKTWIDEMRVSPSTLVWREGWDRWETAGEIFPQVRRLFAANENEASSGVANDGDAVAPRDDSAAAFASLAEAAQLSGVARRYADDEKKAFDRQKKARRTFGLVVALLAAILGLLGVLIFVLTRR